MRSTGIRQLKNNLSRYVRRAEAGERVLITDRGRVVAELVPSRLAEAGSRRAALLAAGVVRQAREGGDPLAGMPALRLPRGTAAALIDADRAAR